MKAAQYTRIGGPIEVVDVPDPACPPDGVVVAVRATGICRSDWHAWHGHDEIDLPHIGGHEYAGDIVEIGPEVKHFAPGDRVTVPFVCGCGRCEFCRSGNSQVCPQQHQPGFDLPGSFAELVAVPAADTNVVALDHSIDFASAAALGCRFATAFRAVTMRGAVEAGQWVAVHGCGGVGLSAVMIAVAFGARVVAVDVSPDALRMATEFGASHVIDARNDPATGEAIRELTGGGCHVSIDALGTTATAVQSILSLRRRGRHVQVGLLVGEHADPALPMARVIGWELDVLGSHGMASRDYPRLLAMVETGQLRPSELVTQVIALDGIGAALSAMDHASPSGITVAVP